ncbi:type II toxin-antitoxin system RelE/ParE family toxin [Asticcacaulis sp. BYS171W]|uniref:Type II toxin-antitoxin system RelE/ParE family toxin n=1 Tax=Asticcacaulis aquaticus TaxID=2984212 RepID=A0ABT5HVS8_9CAUL|nr:type II toxin-antitoxin system RelE/ParE family toxin [Asticcacaulis aquaticus]MDC7684168.1 type II toxin-antitoxin system RelE/ParE family toxin [Asticcacaulis aquaticus]
MPTVRWSRGALDDVKAQITYISADNPLAAQKVIDRLNTAADALGRRLTGRPGRVTGSYETSVTGVPYILCYEVWPDDTVYILRVIHTARDWPEGAFPKP